MAAASLSLPPPRISSFVLPALAALALAGCGDAEETPIDPEPMEDLAPVPRIGPVEQESEVTGPVELTDCNAVRAEPFIGREADLDTRVALLDAVAPLPNVRWIGPGESVDGNLEPTRLTVFLDADEVITGLRCG